jgi:EAL domain-containing protein (putative c-di-GMP-specific phosphodiesterase class I)
VIGQRSPKGIETEVQLERLRTMGCTLGQGYLLGRPLESGAMLQLVTDSRISSVRNTA